MISGPEANKLTSENVSKQFYNVKLYKKRIKFINHCIKDAIKHANFNVSIYIGDIKSIEKGKIIYTIQYIKKYYIDLGYVAYLKNNDETLVIKWE